MFIVAYCEYESCPYDDTAIIGETFENIDGVRSWNDCGNHCHSTNGCNYWTFYVFEQICHLKYNNDGLLHNFFATSGDKICY